MDASTSFVTVTRRVPLDGVELAWDQWGPPSGVPLVLGHGFSGSVHDFSLQIDALAARHRVLAFDHRGHGLSTKTHDATTYTVDQLVLDEIAFLEQVAREPVDLLGHSLGGRVALGVVLARPDLVRSLVLMDTTASEFAVTDSKRVAAITAFFAALDPAKGLPDMTMRGPEDDLIDRETPQAWRERKEQLTKGLDPYAIQALGLALFSGEVPSVHDQLGGIDCPVTVIVGSEDHPFIDQAPALAEALPHGTLTVIEGAYHSPQLTHAEQWRGALESHLASVN